MEDEEGIVESLTASQDENPRKCLCPDRKQFADYEDAIHEVQNESKSLFSLGNDNDRKVEEEDLQHIQGHNHKENLNIETQEEDDNVSEREATQILQSFYSDILNDSTYFGNKIEDETLANTEEPKSYEYPDEKEKKEADNINADSDDAFPDIQELDFSNFVESRVDMLCKHA